MCDDQIIAVFLAIKCASAANRRNRRTAEFIAHDAGNASQFDGLTAIVSGQKVGFEEICY